MTRWLKMLGSGDNAMDESVVPQVLRELGHPRRPTMRVGDRLVLYALGHDRAFAIVVVFTPVRPGEGPNPWDRWRCEVREAMSVSYADAPRLDDLNAPGGRDLRTSIRQQSHLRLEDAEYDRAVAALRAAGAREDSLYRP